MTLTAFPPLSNTRDDAARLKWHGVRCLFEDAQSDILLLLDTCSVKDSSPAGSHGLKQAIAARGPEQKTSGPNQRTFTSILIECLRKFASAKQPFSVKGLYDALVAQKVAEQGSSMPLTNGAEKASAPPQLPIHFTLTPGKGQSMRLVQLPPGASATANNNPVPSPQKPTDGDDKAAKASSAQAVPPQAVHDLLFDESRVLACTTFVGEASPDMAYFNKWLEDTPEIADQVAVEAMFLGPPTMLLISMSLSIWDVVRHDKVCIFLGYIGSHNFVHLYQQLVGPAGAARISGRTSAKEVEHGRILLEARDVGTNRSQQDTEGGGHMRYRALSDGAGAVGDNGAGPQVSPYNRAHPPRSSVKDEGEDSAEMKEAAEQLKALSHIRHPSNNGTPTKQRSSLPDSAPDRHDDSNRLNGMADGGVDGVDYATPSKKHVRRSIPKQTPKHETRCSYCSHAPFKDSSSLRKHIAAAHTRPFPCAFSFAGCESTFGSKNEWKRHITSQHLCLQYYRCSSCPTSVAEGKYNEFNRKDLFTQHLRRMHAPFAIKKSLTMVDSKTQLEWDARVKDMQQSCLVQRRYPPQRSACPKPGCQSAFEGPGSWDEWTEHVGRHMEKNEAERLGVDRHLAQWALDEGIIERNGDGEYKLIQENFAGSRGQDMSRDSITMHTEGLSRETTRTGERSEGSNGDPGGGFTGENAGGAGEGERMEVDA